MNYSLQPKQIRLVLLGAICLVMLAVPFAKRARAAHEHEHEGEAIQIKDLAGSWQAAIVYSNTGCGPASGLVNFTLDSTGNTNMATLVFHTHNNGSTCSDSTSKQTFTIHTLNADGSGTAGLTCGAGCGWEFHIQVDRQRSMFNMVDVNFNNPDNFVAGTAIRQIKPDSD
jgi:hypothetical protein